MKFSTPRLRRVTPMPADRRSLASVSVPGSHSKVISSACVHGVTAVRRFDQAFELLRGQERRRAAAEVDEVRAAGRQWPASPREQLPLARQHVEVVADFLRVLVGVDAEVAEVTPLPAERDVQVEAERHARPGGAVERRHRVALDGLGRPHRERRIGGDEIAADAGVVANRSGIRHASPTISAHRASSSAEIERFPVERGLESLRGAVRCHAVFGVHGACGALAGLRPARTTRRHDDNDANDTSNRPRLLRRGRSRLPPEISAAL